MQLDIHAINKGNKGKFSLSHEQRKLAYYAISLNKKTVSIAHVISEKLSRNAPKGAKKSQQESITQVNKQKQRLKTEQNGQEQSKHFMDHQDSNRYRFKSSRVARNATE